MAFTYGGDPSASKSDWLRFVIGDTDVTKVILTDAEVSYIIETYKSEKAILAAAFRQCANHYARTLVKRTLGPQSEDATKRHEYYARMADKYEKEQGYAGIPPLPEYAAEKVFDKDMMSNDV